MIDFIIISYIVKQLLHLAPNTLQVITDFDILTRRTELSLEDIHKNILQLSNQIKSMKVHLERPPVHDHDHFAEEMMSFYQQANKDIQAIQSYYQETVACYSKTCLSFGENVKTTKSTELFGYVVSFISALKISHKHILDQQAEEKLKKVAQDWQNLALSTSTRQQGEINANQKQTPPPFKLPELRSAKQGDSGYSKEAKGVLPPSTSTAIKEKRQSTEQNEKNEKKRSIWTRLFGH